MKAVPCRSCGKPVVFLKTGNKDVGGSDKLMPIDADTVDDVDEVFNPKIHKSHFASCPRAGEWRKPKATGKRR